MDTAIKISQIEENELKYNNIGGQIFESKPTIKKNGFNYDTYTKEQFIQNNRYWYYIKLNISLYYNFFIKQ